MKYIHSWLAPGGLVALAALVGVRLAPEPALATLVRGYPYAVFGAVALLAWRFHRSRVVAAALALALAHQAFLRTAGGASTTLHATAAVVLPLALGALVLMQDRGLLSWRGLIQLALVLLPVPIVGLLLRVQEAQAAPAPSSTLGDPAFAFSAAIPQPQLLAFALSITVAAAAAVLRGKAVEKGFFWSLLVVVLAVSALPGSASATVYLMAAGLILGLSVVETGYSMAYRDELTGLPSRRAFPDTLAALGSRYAIAMVDIDHFKQFNDKHGHDVGDQVLRMVAGKLGRVAGGGRAFRYGGEEFAVIFAGRSRDEAMPHLEELRSAIGNAKFTVRGHPRARSRLKGAKRKSTRRKKLAVTVSIGVAERNGRYTTPERVLKAADKALYRAKRAGRNQVRT